MSAEEESLNLVDRNVVDLVPIKLEVHRDGRLYRDTFTWDLTHPDADVKSFVQMTCQDLNLPPAFGEAMLSQMMEQIEHLRQNQSKLHTYDYERLENIKVDVRVGPLCIQDQFAWDLSNLGASPEEFARRFCDDLGLDQKVAPHLSAHIRDQLLKLRRGIRKGGLPAIIPTKISHHDHGLSDLSGDMSARKKLKNAYGSDVVRTRQEWDDYAPEIMVLSDSQLAELEAHEEEERAQQEQEAEQRRRREEEGNREVALVGDGAQGDVGRQKRKRSMTQKATESKLQEDLDEDLERVYREVPHGGEQQGRGRSSGGGTPVSGSGAQEGSLAHRVLVGPWGYQYQGARTTSGGGGSINKAMASPAVESSQGPSRASWASPQDPSRTQPSHPTSGGVNVAADISSELMQLRQKQQYIQYLVQQQQLSPQQGATFLQQIQMTQMALMKKQEALQQSQTTSDQLQQSYMQSYGYSSGSGSQHAAGALGANLLGAPGNYRSDVQQNPRSVQAGTGGASGYGSLPHMYMTGGGSNMIGGSGGQNMYSMQGSLLGQGGMQQQQYRQQY